MKGRNIFWGVFFVAAAALIIVNQMGLFVNVGVFSILFTIVLAAIFIKSLWELSWVGIFFPLAFGAIIYTDQLGLNAITPWYVLLAALMLSIGASFLFGSSRHHYKGKKYKDFQGDNKHSDSFNKTTENLDGECLYSRTRFGASTKYIHSANFKEATIECSFGQVDVYFDEVATVGDEAHISVNVSFGECNLYLPKEWQVDNQVHASFADAKEKNYHDPNGTPYVKVTGNVSFGDCNIIYI